MAGLDLTNVTIDNAYTRKFAMLVKIHKLAYCMLDIFIVFVCLIGAGEIKSYACVSDDEYESAMHEFHCNQEVLCRELDDYYYHSLKATTKDQSTQTEKSRSLPSVTQRSFFDAMSAIPNRKFVIFYCMLATILSVDGLLTMRMAGYLSDLSLFDVGVFEFVSGTSLLAMPYLAFNLSISDATSKKACAFSDFYCIVSFMNWMGGRAV